MTLRKKDGHTVFEAVDHARKEIYVGMTPYSMSDTITLMRTERPACLKAWDFDDAVLFRSLEFDLTEDDARALIKDRLRKPPPKGYRYCVESRASR